MDECNESECLQVVNDKEGKRREIRCLERKLEYSR